MQGWVTVIWPIRHVPGSTIYIFFHFYQSIFDPGTTFLSENIFLALSQPLNLTHTHNLCLKTKGNDGE